MSKVIIFDLDGTIFDTIEDITSVMNFALNKYGYKSIGEEEMKGCVGGSAKEMVVGALTVLGESIKEEVCEKIADAYVAKMLGKTDSKNKIFDGIGEVVSTFRKIRVIA